ncbi:transmembrane protein 127-like [Artemia franciscana]|uniref:transmembrane protein 127-like n=1 Tax=Artemia franciscana TaxID=6661 RepID=UPI0032DA8223
MPPSVSTNNGTHQNRKKTKLGVQHLSAFLHMFTTAFLSMSLSNLPWFQIDSPFCSPHIGSYLFLNSGHFSMKEYPISMVIKGLLLKDLHQNSVWISQFITSGKAINCVTPQIVLVLRLVLIICVLSILCALSSFLINILALQRIKLAKNHISLILSILTVIACIVTICLSSYSVILFQEEGNRNQITGLNSSVTFDYGFYAVGIAGFLSLCAVTSELIISRNSRRGYRRQSTQRVRLLNDSDDSIYQDTTFPNNVTPPPPYTP